MSDIKNDKGKINVIEHLLIRNKDTGEKLISKRETNLQKPVQKNTDQD